MRRVAVGFAALIVSSVGLKAAETPNFTTTEVSVGAPIVSIVGVHDVGFGRSVLVTTKDETDRAFYFLNPKDGTKMREPIIAPDEMLFFDIAETSTPNRPDALLILTAKGVAKLNAETGTFDPIVETTSIFGRRKGIRFERGDFAHDLDGNGLFDLVVPDFDKTVVLLQTKDGFESVSLPIVAEQRFPLRPELTASGLDWSIYAAFPKFVLQRNLQKAKDLIFHVGDSLQAFLSDVGSFPRSRFEVALPSLVRGNTWEDEIAAFEANTDQSKYDDTIIMFVEDLDQDELPDLVIERSTASGVFDRQSSYLFFFAKKADDSFVYPETPDTTLDFNGFVADLQLIDVNGDGLKDVAATHVNFSLRKVISILLTGAARMKLDTFLAGKGHAFNEADESDLTLTVDIDMSKGSTATPVVKFADVDDDNDQDLIVSKNNDTLRLLAGGPSPFEEELFEIKADLPRNGDFVSPVDLDDDGDIDFVYHYDRLGEDGRDKVDRLVLIRHQ